MRVMCVTPIISAFFPEAPKPEVGDIDEVIDQFKKGRKIFYTLSRYEEWSYHSIHFATLPEQTADEMNEVEKEAIIM